MPGGITLRDIGFSRAAARALQTATLGEVLCDCAPPDQLIERKSRRYFALQPDPRHAIALYTLSSVQTSDRAPRDLPEHDREKRGPHRRGDA